MSYTVTQMISDAFFEAVIVARGTKTLTEENLATGLQYFNEVLATTLIDEAIVPYYKEYEFNLLENIESYDIPNLISIQTFTFFQDSFRYSIAKDDFREYWGSPKATNIDSLPSVYFSQRILGGSKISVTPNPSQTYPAVIWGSFGLLEATYNQDLSLIYDKYYIVYLRALLGDMLCLAYGKEMPEKLAQHLIKFDKLIRKRSAPLDLTTNIINPLNKSAGYNYTIANLATNGFLPSGGY